jgi:TatD DNase family protein
MEWIDTHTHLYVSKFDHDREAMIERAVAAGMSRFYLPNIDSRSIEGMLELERDWPERCFPMMGLHPSSVKENYREELSVVRQWLDKRHFVAVGEIGIDLYWDKTYRKQQEEAFLQQCEWAEALGVPIAIHSRESIDLLIDLLRELNSSGLWGVFHCFTGTPAQGEAIRELGFYLGIGGVLTYKNSGLDATMARLGLERVVVETDAPYLAPVPYRGKRNESAYVVEVGRKLARVLELPEEVVARRTTQCALELFPDVQPSEARKASV